MTVKTPDQLREEARLALEKADQEGAQTESEKKDEKTKTGKTKKTRRPAWISFDVEQMKAKGYGIDEGESSHFTKRGIKAGFIKGDPTKSAALARKIANTTITDDMALSDIAKIKKARLWYTGQTKGSSKGQAAKFSKTSIKAQIRKPIKPQGSPGTFDDSDRPKETSNLFPGVPANVRGGLKAPKGYMRTESGDLRIDWEKAAKQRTDEVASDLAAGYKRQRRRKS